MGGRHGADERASHCPVWQKATHTGRRSGHPPSLVKALVTRVITSSQRKRASRPPEHARAVSSRPPCCAMRVFVNRSTLAGVNSVGSGRFKGRVPRPPVHPMCPLNHAGETTLPERHGSRGYCHGSFPFPEHDFSRGNILVVGPPGTPVFRWTCPRATPWLSHLFPDGTIGLSAFDMASGPALCSPWLSLPFPATSTGMSTGTSTASFIAVGTWR